MKKNRNPERTKTLKEKGKIPFRYRFFLGGASFFLALMILVTGVAFAFRETIGVFAFCLILSAFVSRIAEVLL